MEKGFKNRVLVVGCLPKEIGGSYSSGVTNVVYSLLKIQNRYDIVSLFATNISNSKSNYVSRNLKRRVYGYRVPIKELIDSIFSPIATIKELRKYRSDINKSPLRYFFYRLNLDYVIRKVNPNIVHVHGVSLLLPLSYSRVANEHKVLVTFHGIFYKGNNATKNFKNLYLNSIKNIDYCTFLTEEMRVESEKFLGLKLKYSAIVPNGINTDRFKYSEMSREELRFKFKVGVNEKVLITVGSIQKRKGQLDMIGYLQNLCFNGQYWMIGLGPDYEYVKKYIEDNSLGHKYRLLGYVPNEELYGYYSAADVYIHNSSAEGQALSAIEALSTGLKVYVNSKIKGTLGEYSANSVSFTLRDTIDFNNVDSSRVFNDNGIKTWDDISCEYHRFYNYMIKN